MATLLYYDPDPAWRETIGRDLLGESVTVLTAACFGDAIALARSEPFDAVAADPPETEVRAFVSAVGQLRRGVPIVLFMPLARALPAFEGMNSGADRFVEKREPAPEAARALANAVRAAIGRRTRGRSLEERTAQLEFLSRTALDFIGMGTGDDPYDYIARRLAEIVDRSSVAAASLDAERGILTTRAVAGPPEDLAVLEEELGRPFVGIEMAVASEPAARVAYGCRTLVEGPSSLSVLFFNLIPAEVGERIDDRLAWGRSYVMGLSCREGVLGNVTIRVKRGAELENRDLVEAFVGQASVALLRQRASRRLLESEARYRAVVESQHELVCRFRPDGTHLFANDAYCRFFGLDPASIGGTRFAPVLPEDERERLRAYFAGFSPSSPDGTIEHRVAGADGTVRWLQWSDQAFFGPDGRVEEFQSVGRDVTERREAEAALAALTAELEARVETATAGLRAANRDLEAFSRHVSHDLRAPLRAIDGYLGIMMARFGPDLPPDAVVYVGRAREGVVRANRFIEALLSLSRLSSRPLQIERVEPAAIVRSVLDELLPAPGERRVKVEVAPLPPCRADPEMLRHVYQNLLSNALKFTRTRNPARIGIGASAAGREAVFFVSDNGVGFPPEVAEGVYDDFARFHDPGVYEGSGLGLPLVRRIVERHGGRCWAEGAVDGGATFSFALPHDPP